MRETASQKVAKSGLIRRMEPRIDEAQAVAAAVAKASCPSFGEKGQKIAHNAATIPMDGNRWNGLIFAFAWRAADKRRPCLHCG